MELPLVVNVSLKSRSYMYALCNSLFAIYRYYMYSVRLSTMHEDHFTTYSHSHSHSNFS